ncbi:MAG: putative Ig domain-containing protein, partial [Mycoplasmataceae bacterium]|nr:putative Ig domain-containing protein [Mycoplasmataceae bacterium]
KIAISLSVGTVATAAAVSVGFVAANTQRDSSNNSPVNANTLSVNFNIENNKVHSHKLISEPVGYVNGDLQLEVRDANGNIVNDAIFTSQGLPEGINVNNLGVLNGAAQQDGIFMSNITVSSPSLNASTNLDVEIDVPKPIEVQNQDVHIVDVVNYKGADFSIATNDPNDRYDVIEGVLPKGVILDSDTGVFSGLPQEAGQFDLIVRVSIKDEVYNDSTYTLKASNIDDYNKYAYADIHVSLYVETIEEALTIGVEETTKAIQDNVDSFNALVNSLYETLDVGKDIYNKNVEIVNDINNIIDNTKNTFSEIVDWSKNASEIFTADWWKNAGNAAWGKVELTVEQYSEDYFLPIAQIVDGAVDMIDTLKNSLGSVLSLVGVELPEIKETYQSLINMAARVLTGDKVYLNEFTGLLELLEDQLIQTRDAFDAIMAYAPSDEQTQAWQQEINDLKIQLDQYPAFVDAEGSIPNGSKTEGSFKTTAEWRNVTYRIEDDQVVITGGEARHSFLTWNQWVSLSDSEYVKTTCDINGHIEIKLFDFVTIFSFDAPANPERFTIQQQIDEIQAKIDASSITSGLLDNETKQQIASIGEVINTIVGMVTQVKEVLPTVLEYMAQFGADGIQLPWSILENKQASELTSLTDIANAIHEDYLFNVERWNAFTNQITGLYDGGVKIINDIKQIPTDLQTLIEKIQTTVEDAQAKFTDAINENINQFNQFLNTTKQTIQSIKDLLDIINNIV